MPPNSEEKAIGELGAWPLLPTQHGHQDVLNSDDSDRREGACNGHVESKERK